MNVDVTRVNSFDLCWLCRSVWWWKYTLISHLHEHSKVFGLRLVDIYSEYRFQIHQVSLYSIDFVRWLPWKESDYFCTQSVRTIRAQQQLDKSAFNVCVYILWYLYEIETKLYDFFCAFLFVELLFSRLFWLYIVIVFAGCLCNHCRLRTYEKAQFLSVEVFSTG